MKNAIKKFVLLLIIACICGCKKSPDSTGTGRRIVSLAPSLTTMLCQLGLLDDLVGVTDFCKYDETFAECVRQGKIRRVSGFNAFNFELVSSVEPDYIFALDSVTQEQWLQFKKMFDGTKTVIIGLTHPKNFGELKTQFRQIGEVLHCEETADKICGALDSKLSQMLPIAEDVTVLPEIYYPPFITVGKDTFIADIIRAAGGKLAVSDDVLWPSVTTEQLLLINPDVVITETARAEQNHNLMLIDAYRLGNIFVPSDKDAYMQPGIAAADIAAELNRYLFDFIKRRAP